MNMTDYDSDIYEHEMYVIEVFDEWKWNRKGDDDYLPDFFRGYRSDEDIRRIYEMPEDEDLTIYQLDSMIYIYKTPILSKCQLYNNEWSAKEECEKIEKFRLKTKIRKVDVRLKDE